MKKYAGIALLAFSLFAGMFLTILSVGMERYHDCIVGESSYDAIIASRMEDDTILSALSFDGETLLYDASDHLFYYSLIESSASAKNPYIKYKSGRKLKFAFLYGEITEETIKNNKTIPFIAYTDDRYCCYGLRCTTLPLMNIYCGEEIGDGNVSMHLELFDNRSGAARRVTASDGTVRVRGASARTYPKKGYRLALEYESLGGNIRGNDVSLLGMRKDDDWLLYAAYNDPEKIRNVFSSNLWEFSCATDNADHVNAGMEYKYLELFLNGRYWGLYALGYPIDEKQLEANRGTDKNALYKKITWTNDRTADFSSAYEIKTTGGIQDNWYLINEYYRYLSQNANNTKELYQGIDLDNAIDFLLFCNMIQGLDNVSGSSTKNLYLFLKEKNGSISALYTPWDMDIAWGNVWSETAKNYTIPYGINPDYNRTVENGYLNQIIINNDSDIWEKIFEKYRELRNGGWSEDTINRLLDSYEAQIYGSGAYLRDMERWPDGMYAEPDIGLSKFRAYVAERLKEADQYYMRLEEACRESIYVQRGIQYKDFRECDFIIEINDKTLLENDDYISLFRYLGIDPEKITGDVHFILANPSEEKYEYRKELVHDGETVQTAIGEISALKDESKTYTDDTFYTVYLDGVACFDCSPEGITDIRMVFLNGTSARIMDFTADYHLETE